MQKYLTSSAFVIILIKIILILGNVHLNNTNEVTTDMEMGTNPNVTGSRVLQRGKRYLDYLQKSRIFFRSNVKVNLIKVNQLWAHGYGFRANYPIENDKEHRPFRRDVYEAIGDLMDHHGFDGKACILKAFCAGMREEFSNGSGILFKLFKLVFTLEERDRKIFPHLKTENCEQIFHHHCPLSFNNLSPFTDDF